VHKENKHEAGCTKKFAEAQETKEAPCFEKVHSGEGIKGDGSVKLEEQEGIGSTHRPDDAMSE
jgi:hypothetical protein